MPAKASPTPTATNIPALSVIVASVNGWDVLGPTLRALDAQPEREQIEIVVVDAVGGATRERLAAHCPSVELIAVADRLSIPMLRYLGVQRARGRIVAIVEDHCEVGPAWADAILKTHQRPCGAVGGPVENGQGGLINWAVYFCEYSSYMAPMTEGEVVDLPGNNIAYQRPHLWRHAHVLNEGKWESWINNRLRADGVPLVANNRMAVRHIKPFRLASFLVQRFHFSRSFAGMRRSEQTTLKRLIYGVGSLALPAVLMARITRAVLRKRRHLGWFALSVPLLVVFLTVGAVGEMVGYFVGPGASLEHVE